MNVASLELCKELYELAPDWTDTDWYYGAEGDVDSKVSAVLMHPNKNCPAYDLGYLLRKLPKGSSVAKTSPITKPFDGPDRFTAYDMGDRQYWADTPEDAACELLVELFKQGVLTKEKLK